MASVSRWIAVAAAGVVGLAVTAGPAAAEESPGRGPEYAPTMLVLDASGSMQAPDPAGGSKMDAAKNAVRTFVAAAPDAAKVGLTAYGTATGSAEADKPAGCRDVKVLRPADALDRAALTAATDAIAPSGYTPIGAALRGAADALPSSGPRSVVLVSDGLDTCAPPDPCEVAKELKQRGVDLVVHSIGFGVDDPSRAQLTCIAQATGGSYTDAMDGAALKQVLPRVSATALRNYHAVGSPITGADSYRTAPTAAPGQHLDTLGQKETRYYAVDIPAGATAYFSGTVSFPRRAGVGVGADLNTLTLRVMDANGADCNVFEHEMATRSSDGEALTVAKMWEGATKEKSGSGSSANCKGGGRYVFSVQWDHVSAGAPARLPIELLVGIEPGVSDPGPKAVLPNMAFADPSGPQTPVTGGGSFNVAAPLPGAGSYTDTLQYGEFVFYKVRLDWGQGLAYRVTYEANGGRGVESITNWETSYFTPFRQRIDFDTGAYTGLQQVSPGKYKELATVPIRYANRQSDTVALRRQSVAGWYYIAVKVGKPSAKGSPAPVRIRLDVTVDGHDSAGPTYTGSADVFGDNSPPKRPAAATGDIDSQSKAASPEKDSHTGLIIGIAAAVAVIAAATGGFLVTRLRSRR